MTQEELQRQHDELRLNYSTSVKIQVGIFVTLIGMTATGTWMFSEFMHRIDQIEGAVVNAGENRWKARPHMSYWTHSFQTRNPNIDVPTVDDIFREVGE